MNTSKFLKSLFFMPLVMLNYTANATDLPFVDGFEGSMSMGIHQHPNFPTTVKTETCPSGRSGKCLYLSNLVTKYDDYRPAIVQTALNIQNGQSYTVSLNVKSDRQNQFKVYVKDENLADWNPISGERFCYANTEWTTCSFSFVANIPITSTIPNFTLMLELGQAAGSLWLDNVSIGSSSTTTGTTTQQCPTNAATCGFYTQQEIINAANAAKLACQTSPSSCGIAISSGYTQAQLDAARQTGIQEGINQCKNDPNCKGASSISGIHASFDAVKGELHIPFVDVMGAFNLLQTYDVYLKQRNNSFTFDLDVSRISLVH